MVRTTIACAPCRKSRVKCKQNGTPPCDRCLRKGQLHSDRCVLSGPTLSNTRRKASPQQKRPSIDPCAANVGVASSNSAADSQVASEQQVHHDPLDLLSNMGQRDIHNVCTVFNQKFPELRFLHIPTATVSHRLLSVSTINGQQTPVAAGLFLASVTALCAPMMKSIVLLPPSDQIVGSVRRRVSSLGLSDLDTVKTLLVLSMFEWGVGDWRGAWITSGMAIRMMQTLLRPESSTTTHQLEWQIYNRTIWGCFVMDRLIISGVPQPNTLSCDNLRTCWPSSEEDFVFGGSSTDLHLARAGDELLDHMPGDMAHYYDTLVRGFDIWARILGWITSGGRRMQGMDLPSNHPWAAASPWRLFHEELQRWRVRQEPRSLYPEASVRSHAALGQAEPFAYLNLIYYIGLLFLNREYLPFLPILCREPSGPVDPPFLSSEPPHGWWIERSQELFESSAMISGVMKDLEDVGLSLLTPFPGFCLFSAATTNMYASAFPWMVPQKRTEILMTIENDLKLLKEFREIWQIGEGWWSTIERCKVLYDRASSNPNTLPGQTRVHYSALEFAIQDCSGRVSERETRSSDECVTTEPDRGVPGHGNEHVHEQWMMEDVSTEQNMLDIGLDWDQLWPLCSVQDDSFFPAYT